MKKKTKIILLCLLGFVVLMTAGGAFTIYSHRTCNEEPVRIYLPEGLSQEGLVDTLQVHGILKEGLNTKLFNLQFLILNSKVRPGSYVVKSRMNGLSLVRKFRNGQQDPLHLTIGKFRLPQQLDEYLNGKLMHNDFNIPLDSFYLIRPDTYEFYWTVTPEEFMQRMKKESERFWSKRNSQLNTKHLTLNTEHDIIILASIVEEETNDNEEKPLIASVYLNRLRKGIPLQADPTVKYAVGDFSLRRILNKHLAAESPFNTYLHKGLPPAPICLPSAASVDAVLKAPETSFLYFCASDKMDGTHRFAATLVEHERNAATFHRALNARGIR